jgi:hypothetical protein
LVYNPNFTRVFVGDISTLNGIINQLITWGAPPCTVDVRNPALGHFIPLMTGFLPSKVVQDFATTHSMTERKAPNSYMGYEWI